MKPKFIYTTETEIPEALKPFYAKQGDGWQIDIEGAPDPAKLAEFRNNNITLQKKLTDVENRFKDIDPDVARQLLADKALIETEKAKIKDGLEPAIRTRIEPMQKEWEGKLTAAEAKAKEAEAKLTAHLVRSAVTAAAMKEGVKAVAIDDIIARAGSSVTVENGELIIRNPKGETRYDAATGNPFTVEQWMAEQSKAAPHLFEENRGSGSAGGRNEGGNKNTGVNPWDPKALNLTEQAKIFKADPTRARQLASQHGVKL